MYTSDMIDVKIIDKTFVDDEGKNVDYQRLALIGVLNEEAYTLEIKLSKAEMQMVKAMLLSDIDPADAKTGDLI